MEILNLYHTFHYLFGAKSILLRKIFNNIYFLIIYNTKSFNLIKLNIIEQYITRTSWYFWSPDEISKPNNSLCKIKKY